MDTLKNFVGIAEVFEGVYPVVHPFSITYLILSTLTAEIPVSGKIGELEPHHKQWQSAQDWRKPFDDSNLSDSLNTKT